MRSRRPRVELQYIRKRQILVEFNHSQNKSNIVKEISLPHMPPNNKVMGAVAACLSMP
jgi:hypothetical protein